MSFEMTLGPLMLGLDGPELSADERELLLHPQVGGVQNGLDALNKDGVSRPRTEAT